jgi:hypothetical protein
MHRRGVSMGGRGGGGQGGGTQSRLMFRRMSGGIGGMGLGENDDEEARGERGRGHHNSISSPSDVRRRRDGSTVSTMSGSDREASFHRRSPTGFNAALDATDEGGGGGHPRPVVHCH